ENGEIGGEKSDIKCDKPPNDAPNPEYGQAVINLTEYIYKPLTDDKQRNTREINSFISTLELYGIVLNLLILC
ncbi:unnamed protein product, partial [Didymodactylos carnosus]